MEIKLAKRTGAVIKAQVQEANALYQPAVAKAQANKLFMDALIEDAGFDLKEFGAYRLQERDGETFIVSEKEAT